MSIVRGRQLPTNHLALITCSWLEFSTSSISLKVSHEVFGRRMKSFMSRSLIVPSSSMMTREGALAK